MVAALDFKLGARMLRRYPGLSLIGGVALAVAIAIGVLAFELMRQEFFPSLPIADGDRLVRLEQWDRRTGEQEPRALYDLAIWREQLRTVEQLGAARSIDRNLILPDVPPRPVPTADVTPDAFALAGVRPLLGRPLVEADAQPGAPDVIVIGEALWRGPLGQDGDIVGRTLQLGETRATVVGVMPEEFGFPRSQRAWLPLRETAYERGDGPPVLVFGRLAPGATLEEAAAELERVGAAADATDGERLQPRVSPFAARVPQGAPSFFWVLPFVGVFLILLAVSANVATLMFARTALRESEIVVRTALGATRGRVITQLLTESLVLAGAATVVGLSIAAGVLRFIWYQSAVVRQIPQPFWRDASLEPVTVLWAAGLALFATVVVGLLPGIKATGDRVQRGLARSQAGAGLRFGGVWSFVIVAQVALTVLCLPIGIGVTQETLRDHRVRAAFASQGYLTFRVQLEGEPARLEAAHRELERRLLAEPGIEAVTLANGLPGTGHPLRRLEARRGTEPPFLVNGNQDGLVWESKVDPGYFDVFPLPIVAGRGFANGDVGARTALVNESLAKNLGGDPLGTSVRWAAEREGAEPGPWLEVVGVATNDGMTPTDRGDADYVYEATAPAERFPGYVGVRMREAAGPLAARVPAMALEVDPELRVYDVLTLDEVVRRRSLGGVAGAIGVNIVVALAIALSAAGLFALMAVAVDRRTREIGIRVALGAGSRGVLRAVFARAATQLGAGILLGNLLVIGILRVLAGTVDLADLLPRMAAISGVMALVGIAACAVPARRALRVQPTEAIKNVA